MHLEHPQEVLAALKAGKAKLLIGWTQGCCARDADGVSVTESAKEEACWCVFGAVHTPDDTLRTEIVGLLNSLVDGGNAVLWNDTPGRTQAEVVQLMDKAIESCEAQCLAG